MPIMKRRYLNIVKLESAKDARLVSAKEGYGEINEQLNIWPLELTIHNKRPLHKAVRRSLEYSKMGIFNLIQKAD